MLTITIKKKEFYDESKNEFIAVPETTLKLEHSLISISKWESKWQKPFLSSNEMSREQTIDYIKCMTLNSNVPDSTYYNITNKDIDAVSKYIDAPMTATTFRENGQSKPNREVITSEIIYYWMIAYEIPFDCEKWHLNRLLTLIRVCSIKNDTNSNKKMSKKDIYSQNKALNDARRQAMHTHG